MTEREQIVEVAAWWLLCKRTSHECESAEQWHAAMDDLEEELRDAVQLYLDRRKQTTEED